MAWIQERLHGRCHQRADTAMSEATDVINKSRSLRKQLEPFKKERDPFASIAAWHRISDDINASESAGALRGPFH